MLKIEIMTAGPQLPYGIVFSRHGKGFFTVQQGVGDVEVAGEVRAAATRRWR